LNRQEQFEREKTEWVTLVGEAILAFGQIELITHRWLAHAPRDAISKAAGRLPFARRVDLILEILEARTLDENGKKFVESLIRAKKLAATRNDVAHNPVMLDIFINEASGDFLLEQSIRRIRGDRRIDLSEMKEFTAAAQDLASAMWLQVMSMTEGGVSVA
jgi:hypothetical protein